MDFHEKQERQSLKFQEAKNKTEQKVIFEIQRDPFFSHTIFFFEMCHRIFL